MKNTTLIGRDGEQKAVEFLEQNSYKIIKTNYKTRFGEIDIIAHDDKFLVFVEVKKRKSKKFGNPCEYVTFSKQQKIIKTASIFLSENNINLQPRFDIIEISNDINHIINAFECN